MVIKGSSGERKTPRKAAVGRPQTRSAKIVQESGIETTPSIGKTAQPNAQKLAKSKETQAITAAPSPRSLAAKKKDLALPDQLESCPETDDTLKPLLSLAEQPITPANMRVVDLREELSSRGLSPHGLKKDLVARLEEALGGKNCDNAAQDEHSENHAQNDTIPNPTSISTSQGHDFKPNRSTMLSQEIVDSPDSSIKKEKGDNAGKLEQIKLEPTLSCPSAILLTSDAQPETTDALLQPLKEALGNKRERSKSPTKTPSKKKNKTQLLEQPDTNPDAVELTNRPNGEEAILDTESGVSNVVHISNFVRPFTLNAVKEMVSQFGQVQAFWIDSIKTHCYVKYSNGQEASACKEKLDGIKWPVETGRVLKAEYSTEEDMSRVVDQMESNQSIQPPAPNLDREIVSPADTLALSLDKKADLTLESLHGGEKMDAWSEGNDVASGTLFESRLDKLFMKTETKPSLYYLPAIPLKHK